MSNSHGMRKKRAKIFSIHFVIWFVIYATYTFVMSYNGPIELYAWINLQNIALYMLAYYILRHVQIPYLYDKKWHILFILSLFVSAFLLYTINALGWRLWLDDLVGFKGKRIFYKPQAFLLLTIRYYSPAMAIIVLEMVWTQRAEREIREALEKDKISSELRFLKAQINPHFLFNTLNNLYSYVVTESPKAPEMVKRLTGILEYVLKGSNDPFVPLDAELNSIENFLGLEQVRYGDRLKVSYNTNGDLHTPISPLLLLSIIENAFKHGASGDIDEPEIRIDIDVENDTIKCSVWNTKSKHGGEINDEYKKGIGLKNIQRQLDLIYPNRHTLAIVNHTDYFNVSLEIKPEL